MWAAWAQEAGHGGRPEGVCALPSGGQAQQYASVPHPQLIHRNSHKHLDWNSCGSWPSEGLSDMSPRQIWFEHALILSICTLRLSCAVGPQLSNVWAAHTSGGLDCGKSSPLCARGCISAHRHVLMLKDHVHSEHTSSTVHVSCADAGILESIMWFFERAAGS